MARVLIAIIGIPLIFLITLQGKFFFLGFIILISILAAFEYYKLITRKNLSPMIIIGLLAILSIDLIFYFGKIQSLIPLIILIVLLSGLVELFRKPKFPGWSASLNFAVTLFPVFYIGLSLGSLIGLRELKWSNYSDGGILIVSILAIIWICDTTAYFVGKSLGKIKLYERVSPNKTVEGFIGGLIFALISSFLVKYLVLSYLTLVDAIVVGLIIGVFGQLGDLVESLIKRDVGVKDSSNIIPGHGGVFDRFDSLIYVAPLVYLYIVSKISEIMP